MVVSATEWAASESIAADPESSPATSLATAMARLAAPATTTVPTLSLSVFDPPLPTSSGDPMTGCRGTLAGWQTADPEQMCGTPAWVHARAPASGC